jgi:hypothetical protein
MLDKEIESVGLGLAGELRIAFAILDAGSGEFFYCDLTGSWSLDISITATTWTRKMLQSIDSHCQPEGLSRYAVSHIYFLFDW